MSALTRSLSTRIVKKLEKPKPLKVVPGHVYESHIKQHQGMFHVILYFSLLYFLFKVIMCINILNMVLTSVNLFPVTKIF